MTTPGVPLHMDSVVELPGTPEQVWDAIATAEGISAWFLPTDLEERVGGTIVTHVGGQAGSTGEVTAWEPPHRFAYVEPGWAALVGHPDAEVTPLATEFVVEARSGGSCVVRVASSASGTGADWERETFEGMRKGWGPFLDNLSLYLTHFPGQRATSLHTDAVVPGSGEAVFAALLHALGVDAVGQELRVLGLAARVERSGDLGLLLLLSERLPGYLMFATTDMGDGRTWVQLEGYLFSADAPAYVQREQLNWKAWLQSLAVPAA